MWFGGWSVFIGSNFLLDTGRDRFIMGWLHIERTASLSETADDSGITPNIFKGNGGSNNGGPGLFSGSIYLASTRREVSNNGTQKFGRASNFHFHDRFKN